MNDAQLLAAVENLEVKVQSSRWLTPLNLESAREEFFLNPTKSPQIKYPEIPIVDLQQALTQLSRLETSQIEPSSLEQWVLQRKIEELKLKLELFLHLDHPEFGPISAQLFQCSFAPEFLQQAQLDANSPLPFSSQETMSSSEIVNGINKYLSGYNVHDWSIELVSSTDFYFRVKSQQKRILIGQRFNWDFTNFDNMLAHEIDGHVLRAVNAAQQTNQLLRKPFPFYLKTEEGLASFLGDYCSTTAEICRKHHALKYLAGHLAQTSSFTEVFEFLVSGGFSPDLAFQRTFRLKRGLSDTGQPGCFAKEAMYYEGMLEVKEYIDQEGNIEKLYVAKVGLEDLKFVEEQALTIIPPRLKVYLEFHARAR